MMKFKKTFLRISLLTISSIFSINCIAMKNNDIKNLNTIKNNEKQSQNPYNNSPYNPFYGENFLNKKRNLKDETNEKPNIKNPKKKIENKDEENSLNIRLEENLKEPNIKSQEKRNNENKNKNIINSNIEEDSEEESEENEESSESYEDKEKSSDELKSKGILKSEENEEKSNDELDNENLLKDIKMKTENLNNILNDIKNDIEKRKNNLFILFDTYYTNYILKKMDKSKINICQHILSYLIDKKISKNKSWYSHLNKYLLKDFFKEYLNKDNFISGFCASLQPNFIFPAFDNSKENNDPDKSDELKENAENMLNKFIDSFEESKTRILNTCSNKEDVINLKKDEFLEVLEKISTVLSYHTIDVYSMQDFWEGDNDYAKLKEDVLNKIEDLKKTEKDKNSLKKGIEEIYDYISSFLKENEKNIKDLIHDLSKENSRYIERYNKEMKNVFKYSKSLSEQENSFTNLKNEFKNFIDNYYKNNSTDENKKNYDKILESLTLKELQEVINNTYNYAYINHINNNLQNVDYTSFTHPIRIIFKFNLNFSADKNPNLTQKIYDDILKTIKTNIDNSSSDETEYLFSPPSISTNPVDKTSTIEFNLIYTGDNFSILFWADDLKNKLNWEFKDEVLDECVDYDLKNFFPINYANKLLDIYKKIIEDKKIDIKTLNIDTFLEEAKDFPLDEYSSEFTLEDIDNINDKEERKFYNELFNKTKENFIKENKDIIEYRKNTLMYAFVGFQIDFMIETFAKNLKNKYSELIKNILTKANITHNEGDYKITAPDSGIAKLFGTTPQEAYYSFNFNLLLKNNLFNNKDYIDENLKNEENKNLVIEKAMEDTIKELKEMPELEFSEKIKNHFEKNKNNIEKYFEQKHLNANYKNIYRNDMKNFINKTKKENLYINYLTHFTNAVAYYTYFNIKNFD